MPFKETCRLEQRVLMLSEYDTGAFSVVELCARYGVHRDTFYEWRRRRASGEARWFEDGSHAPKSCPHKTEAAVVEAVIALRRRFPHFGPKKLWAWLTRHEPDRRWPAASTIGEMLKREGLVTRRRSRRPPRELGQTQVVASAPNQEWCCDFKGWFRTRDGRRCDPLTVTDTASRYLLAVCITEPTIAAVRPVFERLFAEHGLPQAIRSDNGAPFGSSGAGGLTQLSAWWVKLGIEPHFIPPGSPQDNGRHERMHRTLKDQTTDPPAADRAEQQARFDAFREHYNHERPHEGLGQVPPASCWSPSSRRMPQTLQEPWYDADHQVRRVRTNGEIKWAGGLVYVSEALCGELLGLTEAEDGGHTVRFGHLDLGVIDPSARFLRFAPLRHRLREAQEAPAQQKVSGINPVQTVGDQPG
jgi:transposase InsO family protein